MVSLGLVFLIADLKGTERLGAQLVTPDCDGFCRHGALEVVHNLGSSVLLGLVVEFGDGCDDGCEGFTVYGALSYY